MLQSILKHEIDPSLYHSTITDLSNESVNIEKRTLVDTLQLYTENGSVQDNPIMEINHIAVNNET